MTSEVGKTKFQRFEVGEMLRSAILPHPRNPRMITPKAAKRLKGSITQWTIFVNGAMTSSASPDRTWIRAVHWGDRGLLPGWAIQ